MNYAKPTAAEIDHKLRDDFNRRLRDFGYAAETTDPVLAVLFRTLGGQLEMLYNETSRMQLALLDELIANLGMTQRMARPAQTIVRFLAHRDPVIVEAGTELLGEAESGARFAFMTDASIAGSAARIAFAAVYGRGTLRLLPGMAMSEPVQAARPSFEPVRVNLGPSPAMFLVIEELPGEHLSQHSFFFDISPYAVNLQRAMLTEPWCLALQDGSFGADGLLRPTRANVGNRLLKWLISENGHEAKVSPLNELPALPDGFYAGRIFLFPSVPVDRRYLCTIPKAMDSAMHGLFGNPQILQQPRAWIRIGLPDDVMDLERALANVMLHAVSASNLECFNETVYFQRHGTSIPVSREGGSPQFLVAPLSITGESGRPYVPEMMASSDSRTGRYSIRNGRIHLRPGRSSTDQEEQYANLRIWLTRGAEGNTVGPGRVHSFLRRADSLPMQIGNPTASAGGSDGEAYADAHSRLSHMLLARERIVTKVDLISAVRSFDRRIRSVDANLALRRTEDGVQRTHIVNVAVNGHDFVEPDREQQILQEELTRYIQAQCLFDEPVVVQLQEAG